MKYHITSFPGLTPIEFVLNSIKICKTAWAYGGGGSVGI